MTTDVYVNLAFTVDGYADDRFVAFRATGWERISRTYRFEIDVLSASIDLDLADLVGRFACFSIATATHGRSIYGIVAAARTEGLSADGRCIYRAVLVPRLHRLDLSRQCHVHGTDAEISVDAVIENVLTANSLAGPVSSVAGRLGDDDFEMSLYADYPSRDYVVQYGETDLAFISRLAEHAGIFFFFDQSSGFDRVVFADNNLAFVGPSDETTIPFRSMAGAPADSFEVTRFCIEQQVVPKTVYLRDFNWQMPHLSLLADAEVDAAGHGVVVEYGSHFRTPEEGLDLAQVRAEELLARRSVFDGASNCFLLSAGHEFTLTGHFRTDHDGDFLVTEVEHTVALPDYGIDGLEPAAYANRFTCIPRSVAFRPERTTPKPLIAGLTHAVIDGTAEENRADIDEYGRYKVVQPFDLRGLGDGQASPFIRKAEPYGGNSSGMHFPLPKGTEVVIACINGDPDRPVILGAVPNERNRSMVDGNEATTNRMKTTSGIVFEIFDGNSINSTDGGPLDGSLISDRTWDGPDQESQ